MHKKKILIVDDEKDFTKVVKMNLDITGKYEVIAENNPLNAFHAIRSFKPDLILLDIMMPELDGTEIASQIGRDTKLKDTPIIFLTAAVTKREVMSQKGKIGNHVFIAKPVNIQELINCIEKFQ